MTTYFGACRFNDGNIMYFQHKAFEAERGVEHPNGGWRNRNLYATDQELVDEWMKQPENADECTCGRDEIVDVMSVGSGTWRMRACRHCGVLMPFAKLPIEFIDFDEPAWSPWRMSSKCGNKMLTSTTTTPRTSGD